MPVILPAGEGLTPAGEAITPEQNANNSVAATPITVTLGSAIKVNSLLVLFAHLGTPVANVTTPTGYTIASQSNFSAAARSVHCFYKVAGASESTTSPSLAWTGGGNGRAIWLEYSGLVPVQTGVGDTAAPNSATAATSLALDTFAGSASLKVACLATSAGSGGSNAFSNSWTVRNSAIASLFAGDNADALSLGGTTASWATSSDCAGICAGFKPQISRITPQFLQAVGRAATY